MDKPEVERIAAFEEHFARAQATQVVELQWGFALLQSDFPASHMHNRIVITSAASSEEILSTTNSVLGGAGLQHRYISVVDDTLGTDLTADLSAAGYEADAISTMIYQGASVEPSVHDVHTVSLPRLRPALMRDWKVALPDATDDVLAQLADRTTLYERGADVQQLAVFEGSEIAARAELYLDIGDGVAQFESLYTHPDYRGRGYAQSLIRDAHRRSQEAACELLFLEADLNDWPRQWYRRLGYVDARRTHEFTWRPGER